MEMRFKKTLGSTSSYGSTTRTHSILGSTLAGIPDVLHLQIKPIASNYSIY